MVMCIGRCGSSVLRNSWMMKRLKAISFYECTQSGMKALQHLLLASPVTQCWAHLSFKSAAIILELGGISIQSCKGKVRRICTRRPFLHTNRSLSRDSNEKRPVFDLPVSHFLLLPLIDWMRERLEVEETLPNSRMSTATMLSLRR